MSCKPRSWSCLRGALLLLLLSQADARPRCRDVAYVLRRIRPVLHRLEPVVGLLSDSENVRMPSHVQVYTKRDKDVVFDWAKLVFNQALFFHA